MKKLVLLFLLLPCILKAQIIDVSGITRSAGSSAAITVSISSLPQFTANQGSASSSKPGTVSAVNLGSNNLTFTALTGYEYSKDNSTFTTTLSYTPSGGTVSTTTFYIRMASTATGTPAGTVVIQATGSGAAAKSIAVTGLVNPTSPTITLNTSSLTTFNYVTGTAPSSLSNTVSGSNLTANVGVKAPPNFEISGDNNTFQDSLTLTRASTILSGQPLTIYTRAKATNSPGSYSGNVAYTTTGGTEQDIAVNATVTSNGTTVAKFNFSNAAQLVTGWNNVTGSDGSTAKTYTDAGTGWILTMEGANQQGFAGTLYADDGHGAGPSTDALFPTGVMANFYIQAGKVFTGSNYMAHMDNLSAGTYKVYLSGSVLSTWNSGITTPEWRVNSTSTTNAMVKTLNEQNNTTSHLVFTVVIAPGDILYMSCNTPSNNDPGVGVWCGVIIEKQ